MGTYGYISIIAMFCYGFMLLTFLAAKKDKLVNSFMIMLSLIKLVQVILVFQMRK